MTVITLHNLVRHPWLDFSTATDTFEALVTVRVSDPHKVKMSHEALLGRPMLWCATHSERRHSDREAYRWASQL